MNELLDKDNPILRTISQEVVYDELGKAWVKDLIEELFNIMSTQGAVGVAAPQIGINKRIIVFGTSYSKHRSKEIIIPNMSLINPKIFFFSKEMQSGYEGCLNCGEIMGIVNRPMEVEYSGYNAQGNLITKKASGLEARILQHEIDHLNGILFLDRIIDKNTLTTITELKKKSNEI